MTAKDTIKAKQDVEREKANAAALSPDPDPSPEDVAWHLIHEILLEHGCELFAKTAVVDITNLGHTIVGATYGIRKSR